MSDELMDSAFCGVDGWWRAIYIMLMIPRRSASFNGIPPSFVTNFPICTQCMLSKYQSLYLKGISPPIRPEFSFFSQLATSSQSSPHKLPKQASCTFPPLSPYPWPLVSPSPQSQHPPRPSLPPAPVPYTADPFHHPSPLHLPLSAMRPQARKSGRRHPLLDSGTVVQ